MVSAETVLRIWKRTRGILGGDIFFNWVLARAIPYTATISPRVEALSPGYARVSMRDRRMVRNHLSSIHAAALMNLGEMASGFAFNRALPRNSRAIIVKLSIEFFQKARGKVTVECRCDVIQSLEEKNYEIEAPIRNECGDEVARVTATWRVSSKT